MFTEYTDTIVIEYFADNQANYGYSCATFEHKSQPAPTKKPQQQQQQPQQPQQPKDDPDMHPDDFHEEPHEGFDPDMHAEEFHEEHPEEFHESFNPDAPYDEMGGYMMPRISNTVLIIIIAGGAILLAGIIVLIFVLAGKKRKKRTAGQPPYNTQPPTRNGDGTGTQQ